MFSLVSETWHGFSSLRHKKKLQSGNCALRGIQFPWVSKPVQLVGDFCHRHETKHVVSSSCIKHLDVI
jgi:hypothetical protein